MTFNTIKRFILSKVNDERTTNQIFNFLVKNVVGIGDLYCYTTTSNDYLYSKCGFEWRENAYDEESAVVVAGYSIIISQDYIAIERYYI